MPRDQANGCACPYRREVLRSTGNLLFVGVAQLVGAAILIRLFVKSLIEWSELADSRSGESWPGPAPPAVIGAGFPLLGLLLRPAWRRHRHEPFSERRQEVADPSMLDQADLHPAVDLL